MSVALRGNLKDFGIADVFQLIGQQRKTGVLEFTRKRQRVELRFDRGSVVSASPAGDRPDAALGELMVRCDVLTRDQVQRLHRDCASAARNFSALAIESGEAPAEEVREIEDLLTKETIFAVLRWSGGHFDFRAQEVQHDRPHEALFGAEQILMDGLRMVDEWQSFSALVPSEDTVFQRVASFDTYRERGGSELARQLEAAERVFFLIDGQLSARSVIDRSRLGTFDATRILSHMNRARVIEPVESKKAKRAARSTGGGSVVGHLVRVWLSALLPLALLVLSAGAALRPPAADPSPSQDVAIERDALAAVQAAHAQRRVRRALDAYRLLSGGWPASLASLQDRGIVDPEALAGPAGSPYYYARRSGGALLLAPER